MEDSVHPPPHDLDDDESEGGEGTPPAPARLRLLPARGAPYVIIVRRKPSRRFHIVRWNTETGDVEHGSWFTGRIFTLRSDVSFDGQWMVYLALGSNGQTWNGVCRLPFLETAMEGSNHGTWFGGGYWRDAETLVLNGWKGEKGEVPFKVDTPGGWSPEDIELFYSKLVRDGWIRVGPDFGTRREVKSKRLTVINEGDQGWRSQPSVHHPVLHVRYAGYSMGYQFRFSLSAPAGLLDDKVDSACWDSLGRLVFTREGVVRCFALEDLEKGIPTRTLDLETLAPPAQVPRVSEH